MFISKNFITRASGVVLGSALAFGSAVAQEKEPLLDRNLFSIGAGISSNEAGRDDDTGFQFLVAYELNQINLMQGVNSSVEFGFMDFGFSEDDTGIWGSYVIDGAISEGFGWMAQAGLDVGDDSGLLFGAGLVFGVGANADLRVEYTVRDEVDSLQVNFLYEL